MNTVIIATKNVGKAKEFQTMFESLEVQVQTLLDYPHIEDIEETGNTFEENAILKAETLASILGEMVIADDSGLMIDALDGKPGVYSARYAGEQKNDQQNIDKVLEDLSGVPKPNRTARFYCALAVACPNRETITVGGTCEGFIMTEKRGEMGFGYDPIFYLSDYDRTMAEILPKEKNLISHRANALKKLSNVIHSYFNGDKEL